MRAQQFPSVLLRSAAVAIWPQLEFQTAVAVQKGKSMKRSKAKRHSTKGTMFSVMSREQRKAHRGHAMAVRTGVRRPRKRKP
jgi:hypothetical protein